MRASIPASTRVNRHGRRATAIPVLLALLVLATAGAQEHDDGASGKFFAPLDVPLVNVEVVATDGKGNPVPGLTVDDFEVYEDGAPVAISHFYAAPDLVTLEPGGVSLEGQPAAAEPQMPLYLVLYVDDYMIDPRNRGAVLDHLRQFLEQPLPSGAKLMLVQFDGDLKLRSQFTDDPRTLLPEIDRLRKGAPVNFALESELLVRRMQNAVYSESVLSAGQTDDTQEDPFVPGDFLSQARFLASSNHDRIRTDLNALGRYVSFLGGLSGRKAIFWIGTGFEIRTGEAIFASWQQLFPDAAREMAFEAALEAKKYDTMEALRDLVNFANTHQVSFYTLSALAAGTATESSAEFRDLVANEGRGVLNPMTQEEALLYMSSFSGGRTLADNVGLGEQLNEVSEELASYYSLGYTPPSPGDGKLHKIEVKVRRKGVKLRHRQGYRDRGQVDTISDRTLAAAVFGVADNPMGIAADCLEQEAKPDDTFLLPVVVRIPIGQLVLVPEGDHHSGLVSVHTASRDDQQRLSRVHGQQFPIDIPNDDLTVAVEKEAAFVIGLVMRQGPHRIAVTVRDERSRVESTTFVEVTVGGQAGEQAG